MHKIIPAFVTGEISQEKADQLIERTKAVNDGSLHVFFSDQRPQYREAILKSFGQWVQPERQGTRGPFPKPRLEPQADLLYAQVVKHRSQGRVVEITEKVVFGTQEALQTYLERSPVSHRINTAFVERQNNTMRQHNRRFTRKTLGFSKDDYWLERQVHLCVGYCHFCLPHGGLREEICPPIPTKGSGSPKKWRQVTPMMSVGVTDHVWTLPELLTYRLPPVAHVGLSCTKPRPTVSRPEQAALARASPGAIITSTVKGHQDNPEGDRMSKFAQVGDFCPNTICADYGKLQSG